MLNQRIFAWDVSDEILSFIRANPWATIVSSTGDQGLTVSHFPLLVDTSGEEGLSVCGHLARADADLHALGATETVILIQGPNGYISPSFYPTGTYVPTWNFVVVHLYGRAQVVNDRDTWDILCRTVKHFESEREVPWQLESVDDYARRIAPGTVGFRMNPVRVEAKQKLSQDKPASVVNAVIQSLQEDSIHGNPELAAWMSKYYASKDSA